MESYSPDTQLRDRMHRMNDLLQEIEKFRDPHARARTREIVQSLMDFHGAAVEKMLEHIAASGEPGLRLIDTIAQDDLIANLLLLYGLHPLDLESRVAQALDKCRPYLASHGGNVELLAITDSVVRLRLHGNCHGCPSSAQTLQQTVEEAILEFAPDITAIEVADELITAESTTPSVADDAPRPGHFALPILSAS